MKRRHLFIPSLLLIAVASLAFAQAPSQHQTTAHSNHVIIVPDEIKWGPAPPSLPAGAQIAVLQGDPSKAGSAFNARLKFPDGYKVPPHWHPTDEHVTVLQGKLIMGTGDKFDSGTARELPAGSYSYMPTGVRHYAQAKGETIINVNGTGPFLVNYVNSADDPRIKPSNN